jgi:hypothetical protein
LIVAPLVRKYLSVSERDITVVTGVCIRPYLSQFIPVNCSKPATSLVVSVSDY